MSFSVLPVRLAAISGLAGSLLLPAAADPPSASIEFVAPSIARSQSPRPSQGVFVLDLDGLESPFAARDLVDSWRRRSPSDAGPLCWLHGRARDDLLETARVLVAGPTPACTRILIGLRGR